MTVAKVWECRFDVSLACLRRHFRPFGLRFQTNSYLVCTGHSISSGTRTKIQDFDFVQNRMTIFIILHWTHNRLISNHNVDLQCDVPPASQPHKCATYTVQPVSEGRQSHSGDRPCAGVARSARTLTPGPNIRAKSLIASSQPRVLALLRTHKRATPVVTLQYDYVRSLLRSRQRQPSARSIGFRYAPCHHRRSRRGVEKKGRRPADCFGLGTPVLRLGFKTWT
ncbi:hypothetical protein BJY52DRAFT_1294002 [Lactarius psammicola]|nr:hypothetical protein BJY52DRAFT_1294002 [Lactarius psammicola]